MKKIKINKTLLNIQQNNPVLWKQVKDFQFEDEDVIQSGHQEETYRSDGGDSDHFYFQVERMVLETDEEFEKRRNFTKGIIEKNRKARYEYYLKLKKEFENEI